MTTLALAITALCVCGLVSAQQPAPTRLYVSPAGDDAGPGTADKPLATLPAARDAVRKLTQQGKRMSFYRSRVLNAQIIFEENKIRARLQMIDGTVEDYNYDVESSFVSDAMPIGVVRA